MRGTHVVHAVQPADPQLHVGVDAEAGAGRNRTPATTRWSAGSARRGAARASLIRRRSPTTAEPQTGVSPTALKACRSRSGPRVVHGDWAGASSTRWPGVAASTTQRCPTRVVGTVVNRMPVHAERLRGVLAGQAYPTRHRSSQGEEVRPVLDRGRPGRGPEAERPVDHPRRCRRRTGPAPTLREPRPWRGVQSTDALGAAVPRRPATGGRTPATPRSATTTSRRLRGEPRRGHHRRPRSPAGDRATARRPGPPAVAKEPPSSGRPCPLCPAPRQETWSGVPAGEAPRVCP